MPVVARRQRLQQQLREEARKAVAGAEAKAIQSDAYCCVVRKQPQTRQ